MAEKCLVDPAVLDERIETYEFKVGPQNGAKVILPAWQDPEFLTAIKEDCSAVIEKSTGIRGVRASISKQERISLIFIT